MTTEQTHAQSNAEMRDKLTQQLRDRGLRLTPQREKILEVFFNLPEGDHLSAEELHQRLKSHQLDISLATSYRTLKLLVSVGALRELDFSEDHKHYELSRNPEAPHHHIICSGCGKTEEFESPEVLQLAVNLLREKRYKLTDVQLKLYGLCQDCCDDETD